MSFRTSHGRWPSTDAELDTWVDSVSIETQQVEVTDDGSGVEGDPTDQARAPSS